jgi:hypothetical protein
MVLTTKLGSTDLLNRNQNSTWLPDINNVTAMNLIQRLNTMNGINHKTRKYKPAKQEPKLHVVTEYKERL